MITFDDNPPYILFADDDPDTLAIFRRYVDSFGWAGEFVKTARQIVAAVNEQSADGARPFDALVCDVNYFDENPEAGPRISGVAAARAIRENHPDLPIVFVSAYSTYLIADEVNRIGGEIYQKPVDFEALFERVSWLVRWARSVRQTALPEGDRRRASINRTDHNRRKTDRVISVPEVLTETNSEIRAWRRSTAAGNRAGH